MIPMTSFLRERFQALCELFEIPAPRELRGLFPGWLLIAERWQGRVLVHRRDGFIKKKLLRLRSEPPVREHFLERPIALQQRGRADRTDAGSAGNAVRGI